jgi:hypothetical protein
MTTERPTAGETREIAVGDIDEAEVVARLQTEMGGAA